jgi:NADPH2:quinone reductase
VLADAVMKAIRVHAAGGASALSFEDVADPVAGADDVVVKVEAAGVNFIDVYHRNGLYKQKMPFTPGSEASGRVVAVGSSVGGVAVGDRVAYTGILGAYAELARVPASRVVKVPDGLSAKQAAAAMMQGLTAHYLATSTYPLAKGDSCVVHAAAGGVGLLLCQVAKLRGAMVIATVSTEEKAELARGAGADHVILYTSQPFESEVKRLTGGVGAKVIYDGVGKTTFEKDLECLAPRGLLALFGQSSGPVAPFDPTVLAGKGSLYLTRPTLGNFIASREELVARTADVFGWIRDGKLHLRIAHEFPLANAAAAHDALEGRKTTGKVLLLPDGA